MLKCLDRATGSGAGSENFEIIFSIVKMSASQATAGLERGSLLGNNRLEDRKKDAELYLRIFANLHRCEKCKYFTKYIFAMQSHIRRHKIKEIKFNCQESAPEEYSCRECNFSSHLKVDFKEHVTECHCLKKENEETRFVLKTHICKKCSFWTYSSLVLLDHQLSKKCVNSEGKSESDPYVNEDGVKWYICHHCNHRIKRKDNLKRHILNKHTPSYRIQWCKCVQCDYKAKTKSALTRHMTVHQGYIKWHYCDRCEHKTRDLSSLKRHIYYKHTHDVDVKLYNCDFCKYTTPHSNDLKIHRHAKHSCDSDVKVHQCDKCEYRTARLERLKKHKVSKHETDDVDWLLCGFCDYKALYSSYLKVHVQVKHTRDEDIEWFKCDQCEYKAKTSSGMYTHKRRRHTSDKKIFKCDHCDRMSTSKHNLKDHILRKHTDEKDINWFVCDRCGNKFKTKPELTKHLPTHFAHKKSKRSKTKSDLN